MFLFGMAWFVAFIVIAALVVFLVGLNNRVKRMEKNYELNSIESLKRELVALGDQVKTLTNARR